MTRQQSYKTSVGGGRGGVRYKPTTADPVHYLYLSYGLKHDYHKHTQALILKRAREAKNGKTGRRPAFSCLAYEHNNHFISTQCTNHPRSPPTTIPPGCLSSH